MHTVQLEINSAHLYTANVRFVRTEYYMAAVQWHREREAHVPLGSAFKSIINGILIRETENFAKRRRPGCVVKTKRWQNDWLIWHGSYHLVAGTTHTHTVNIYK